MQLRYILHRLQFAILNQDKDFVVEVIDEFDDFCKHAFYDPATKLERSDESQVIDIIIEMGQINSELTQIQAILQNADRSDFYLGQLSLALGLLQERMRDKGTWNMRDNQTLAAYFLNQSIRYQLKPYSQIADLSFLAKSDPYLEVENPQTVLGKPPKKGSFLFPEKYIWMMAPAYWEHDNGNVPYFTPAEKKLLKVTCDKNGVLNRPIDSGQSLPDGSYLYAISPKGGLYACQIDSDNRILETESMDVSNLHHSSFRAGQPVLCAGSLEVENGVITQIDAGSGHYGVPGINILISCLHLHYKGIVKPTCKIRNPDSDEEDLTVQDLLDNPKYEALRTEYNQLILE